MVITRLDGFSQTKMYIRIHNGRICVSPCNNGQFITPLDGKDKSADALPFVKTVFSKGVVIRAKFMRENQFSWELRKLFKFIRAQSSSVVLR
jgi:hypothetical protein